MNVNTGEIREFEMNEDLPENWVGLDVFTMGKRVKIEDIEWIVTRSVIKTGTPGTMQLSLKAVPQRTQQCKAADAMEAAFTESDATPQFKDAAKAHHNRTGKKEWEK